MESDEAKIARLETELKEANDVIDEFREGNENLEEKVTELENDIERREDAKKELIEAINDKIYDIKALLKDY